MDRKQFLLEACGLGVCGCALGLLTEPATARAEEPAKPDRRLAFARYQVANLIRFMEDDTSARAACVSAMEKTGRECAKRSQLAGRHTGDVEGFLAAINQAWGSESSFDKAKGVVTVVVPEGDCPCPLVDATQTPAFWCNCSIGYQKESFETITGKPVQVALKESKLSGSARCVFEITLT